MFSLNRRTTVGAHTCNGLQKDIAASIDTTGHSVRGLCWSICGEHGYLMISFQLYTVSLLRRLVLLFVWYKKCFSIIYWFAKSCHLIFFLPHPMYNQEEALPVPLCTVLKPQARFKYLLHTSTLLTLCSLAHPTPSTESYALFNFQHLSQVCVCMCVQVCVSLSKGFSA